MLFWQSRLPSRSMYENWMSCDVKTGRLSREGQTSCVVVQVIIENVPSPIVAAGRASLASWIFRNQNRSRFCGQGFPVHVFSICLPDHHAVNHWLIVHQIMIGVWQQIIGYPEISTCLSHVTEMKSAHFPKLGSFFKFWCEINR